MGGRRFRVGHRTRVALLGLVVGSVLGAVGIPAAPASAEQPAVVAPAVEPTDAAAASDVGLADPTASVPTGGLDAQMSGPVVDPWSELPAGPPHLIGAVMVTDPVRGQTIVSGGLLSNSPIFIWNTDTWVWNGSTWANLGNAGLTTKEQRVYGAMAAYDQASGRILRFGGTYLVQGGRRSLTKDTYSWNGSAWSREWGWDGVTEQPPARVGAAMATDPETGHVVMFGGLKQVIPGYDDSGLVPLSDTWTWDGAQWRKVVTASGPTLGPVYRMTSNPAQNDILLFGNDQDLVGRTYRFDGATWREQFTPPEHSIYNLANYGMATATGAAATAVPIMFGGMEQPRVAGAKDCSSVGFGVLLPGCGGTGSAGSPTARATAWAWDTTNNWWTNLGTVAERLQINALTATDPVSGGLLAAGPLVGETPGATLRVAELTFAGPNAVQVAAGKEHTCSLATNGTVSCRGATSVLQADPGNLVREHGTPATVAGPALTGITKVSAGDTFTCALQGGTGKVFCWGSNQGGQLGPDATSATLPNTNGVASQYAFQIPGVTATDIAAGGHSACATVAAGVMCWGANDVGQLGRGTTSADDPVPALVQGSAGFSTPSIGIAHACARAGGAVRCWGANDRGQLGNGTTTPSSTPVVVGTISTATALVTTQRSSCALVGGGLVKCWGRNAAGQLGIGTTVDGLAPGAAVTGVSGATAIAAGAGHVCALGSGAVRCWGSNGRYQLGDGTTAPSTTPVVPVGSWGSISQIAAGLETTCIVAVRQICWGEQLVGISAVTPGFSSVSSSATGPAAVLDLSIPPGTLGAPLTGASVNTWRFDGVISGGMFDGLEQWTFVSNQVLAFSDPLVVGGLTAGREYRFEVALATLGVWGAASAQSPRVKVVTVPGPAPTFTAVAGDRSATLTRSGVPSDGGSPVTQYR